MRQFIRRKSVDFAVKSLDHLGIIAGVMKDLRISELADDRLTQDSQVGVTFGEALLAMILNGLGFSNRVISLTPQFFENKPVELLIRKGIKADNLNRHKLGRTLDAIANYGCEQFFNEIALSVCIAEKIDLRKAQNDTTTFSVEGAYENQDDSAEIHINHGYSKARRPDLKQIILELCVSPDGSIPFVMKPWSGNSSDNKIFNARVKALLASAIESNTGRTVIADSKLYTEENIRELGKNHFITRVPGTIKQTNEFIEKTLSEDFWIKKDNTYKFRSYELEHYGTQMRWIVFYSQQAHDRAKKTLTTTLKKQEETLKKELFHLQAQNFGCHNDAQNALNTLAKKYRFYQIKNSKIVTTEQYEKPGRPTPKAKKSISIYRIEAIFEKLQPAIDAEINQRSCFILATNIPGEILAASNVLDEYKGQDHVEKCFQFMKTPSFFAASFFVKSVKRIQAMLVVMTLALLVYMVAQRRFRKWLKENKKTIPSQIKKPLTRPTLRWAFQLLEGIYQVTIFAVEGKVQCIIQGLNDLKILILSCFGKKVMDLYGIKHNIDTA